MKKNDSILSFGSNESCKLDNPKENKALNYKINQEHANYNNNSIKESLSILNRQNYKISKEQRESENKFNKPSQHSSVDISNNKMKVPKLSIPVLPYNSSNVNANGKNSNKSKEKIFTNVLNSERSLINSNTGNTFISPNKSSKNYNISNRDSNIKNSKEKLLLDYTKRSYNELNENNEIYEIKISNAPNLKGKNENNSKISNKSNSNNKEDKDYNNLNINLNKNNSLRPDNNESFKNMPKSHKSLKSDKTYISNYSNRSQKSRITRNRNIYNISSLSGYIEDGNKENSNRPISNKSISNNIINNSKSNSNSIQVSKKCQNKRHTKNVINPEMKEKRERKVTLNSQLLLNTLNTNNTIITEDTSKANNTNINGKIKLNNKNKSQKNKSQEQKKTRDTVRRLSKSDKNLYNLNSNNKYKLGRNHKNSSNTKVNSNTNLKNNLILLNSNKHNSKTAKHSLPLMIQDPYNKQRYDTISVSYSTYIEIMSKIKPGSEDKVPIFAFKNSSSNNKLNSNSSTSKISSTKLHNNNTNISYSGNPENRDSYFYKNNSNNTNNVNNNLSSSYYINIKNNKSSSSSTMNIINNNHNYSNQNNSKNNSKKLNSSTNVHKLSSTNLLKKISTLNSFKIHTSKISKRQDFRLMNELNLNNNNINLNPSHSHNNNCSSNKNKHHKNIIFKYLNNNLSQKSINNQNVTNHLGNININANNSIKNKSKVSLKDDLDAKSKIIIENNPILNNFIGEKNKKLGSPNIINVLNKNGSSFNNANAENFNNNFCLDNINGFGTKAGFIHISNSNDNSPNTKISKQQLLVKNHLSKNHSNAKKKNINNNKSNSNKNIKAITPKHTKTNTLDKIISNNTNNTNSSNNFNKNNNNNNTTTNRDFKSISNSQLVKLENTNNNDVVDRDMKIRKLNKNKISKTIMLKTNFKMKADYNNENKDTFNNDSINTINNINNDANVNIISLKSDENSNEIKDIETEIKKAEFRVQRRGVRNSSFLNKKAKFKTINLRNKNELIKLKNILNANSNNINNNSDFIDKDKINNESSVENNNKDNNNVNDINAINTHTAHTALDKRVSRFKNVSMDSKANLLSTQTHNNDNSNENNNYNLNDRDNIDSNNLLSCKSKINRIRKDTVSVGNKKSSIIENRNITHITLNTKNKDSPKLLKKKTLKNIKTDLLNNSGHQEYREILTFKNVFDSNSEAENDYSRFPRLYNITPSNKTRKYFTILYHITVFNSIVMIPLSLINLEESISNFNLIFESFLDIITLTEMVLSLITGIYEKDKINYSFPVIFSNYISLYSIINFIAACPHSLIILLLKAVIIFNIKEESLLDILVNYHIIITFIRISRVAIAFSWINHPAITEYKGKNNHNENNSRKKKLNKSSFLLEEENKINNYVNPYEELLMICFQRVLILFLLFFLLTHNIACIWTYIGMREKEINYASWINMSNLQNESISVIYSSSFYFCLVSIFSVGYGDIVPISINERVFTIFFMMFDCVIYAYFLSSLSTLYQQYSNKKELNKQLNLIEDLCEEFRITANFRQKLIQSTINNDNLQKKRKNELIEYLPKHTQNDLLYEMYFNKTSNMIFFRSCSDDFMKFVLPMLKYSVYYNNDVIVNSGELLEKLYLVSEGTISVELDFRYNFFSICRIHKNFHYGDIPLYTGEVSLLNLRVNSNKAEIFSLNVENLKQIKINFKEHSKYILKKSLYFHSLIEQCRLIAIEYYEKNLSLEGFRKFIYSSYRKKMLDEALVQNKNMKKEVIFNDRILRKLEYGNFKELSECIIKDSKADFDIYEKVGGRFDYSNYKNSQFYNDYFNYSNDPNIPNISFGNTKTSTNIHGLSRTGSYVSSKEINSDDNLESNDYNNNNNNKESNKNKSGRKQPHSQLTIQYDYLNKFKQKSFANSMFESEGSKSFDSNEEYEDNENRENNNMENRENNDLSINDVNEDEAYSNYSNSYKTDSSNTRNNITCNKNKNKNNNHYNKYLVNNINTISEISLSSCEHIDSTIKNNLLNSTLIKQNSNNLKYTDINRLNDFSLIPNKSNSNKRIKITKYIDDLKELSDSLGLSINKRGHNSNNIMSNNINNANANPNKENNIINSNSVLGVKNSKTSIISLKENSLNLSKRFMNFKSSINKNSNSKNTNHSNANKSSSSKLLNIYHSPGRFLSHRRFEQHKDIDHSEKIINLEKKTSNTKNNLTNINNAIVNVNNVNKIHSFKNTKKNVMTIFPFKSQSNNSLVNKQERDGNIKIIINCNSNNFHHNNSHLKNNIKDHTKKNTYSIKKNKKQVSLLNINYSNTNSSNLKNINCNSNSINNMNLKTAKISNSEKAGFKKHSTISKNLNLLSHFNNNEKEKESNEHDTSNINNININISDKKKSKISFSYNNSNNLNNKKTATNKIKKLILNLKPMILTKIVKEFKEADYKNDNFNRKRYKIARKRKLSTQSTDSFKSLISTFSNDNKNFNNSNKISARFYNRIKPFKEDIVNNIVLFYISNNNNRFSRSQYNKDTVVSNTFKHKVNLASNKSYNCSYYDSSLSPSSNNKDNNNIVESHTSLVDIDLENRDYLSIHNTDPNKNDSDNKIFNFESFGSSELNYYNNSNSNNKEIYHYSKFNRKLSNNTKEKIFSIELKKIRENKEVSLFDPYKNSKSSSNYLNKQNNANNEIPVLTLNTIRSSNFSQVTVKNNVFSNNINEINNKLYLGLVNKRNLSDIRNNSLKNDNAHIDNNSARKLKQFDYSNSIKTIFSSKNDDNDYDDNNVINDNKGCCIPVIKITDLCRKEDKHLINSKALKNTKKPNISNIKYPKKINNTINNNINDNQNHYQNVHLVDKSNKTKRKTIKEIIRDSHNINVFKNNMITKLRISYFEKEKQFTPHIKYKTSNDIKKNNNDKRNPLVLNKPKTNTQFISNTSELSELSSNNLAYNISNMKEKEEIKLLKREIKNLSNQISRVNSRRNSLINNYSTRNNNGNININDSNANANSYKKLDIRQIKQIKSSLNVKSSLLDLNLKKCKTRLNSNKLCVNNINNTNTNSNTTKCNTLNKAKQSLLHINNNSILNSLSNKNISSTRKNSINLNNNKLSSKTKTIRNSSIQNKTKPDYLNNNIFDEEVDDNLVDKIHNHIVSSKLSRNNNHLSNIVYNILDSNKEDVEIGKLDAMIKKKRNKIKRYKTGGENI